MEKMIFRVNPVIIPPKCMEENGVQGDCFTCPDKDICESPRSMCIRPYKGHPKGCPNFGKLPTCPPNIPCNYHEMFDISEVYAIATVFNKEAYFAQRRANRPDLPEGQITNLRNWQPITLKDNDNAVAEFFRNHQELREFVATRLLECMSVNVVKTMEEQGINLEFPTKEIAYRISFAAKVYEDALRRYGFEVGEETNKEKRGMRTLVLSRTLTKCKK